MMADLTRFALTTAIAQLADWRELLERVGVNIAVSDLDSGTSELIQSLLDDAGLDPTRLVVEVTEGGLVDERREAAVVALSELGVEPRSTTSAPVAPPWRGSAGCRSPS